MLVLRPRLLAVAKRVPVGSRLADVGADHGRLPIWLLQRGLVSFAIAADIAEKPLSRARALAAHCGISHNLAFHLGDGLRGLDSGALDVIVIAGMGGETIADILAASPWSFTKRLLLLPASKPERLEGWLSARGVPFEAEDVYDAGRRYRLFTIKGENHENS